MSILVVADGDERRAQLDGLMAQAGLQAVTTSSARLLSAITTSRPDAVVVDGVENVQRAQRTLERAQACLDIGVELMLVVSASAKRLRALDGELLPVAVVTEADLVAKLGARHEDVESPAHEAGGWRWESSTRNVRGAGGTVTLTASEAAILDLLVRDGGRVVPANTLSRALWGEVILDGHARAAIRTHVYTLRRKLRSIGLGDVLVSAPGWGYRLEVGPRLA